MIPSCGLRFEIATIADHGSNVKKDEPLIVFETEEIDETLSDTRQAIATETLELAAAELALATLEKTVPEKLARSKAKRREGRRGAFVFYGNQPENRRRKC